MSTKKKKIDKPFLIIVSTIVLVGFLIFLSAAFSVLAHNQGQFYSMIFNQAVLGLLGGSILALIFTYIDFRFWKKIALYFLSLATILMFSTLIPGIGIEHGGAQRWIQIGELTLQPVEIFKLSLIIYYSAFLSWAYRHKKLLNWKFTLTWFFGLLLLPFFALYFQNDYGNLLVISGTFFAMLFLSGSKWKHILTISGIGILFAAALIFFIPHVQDRVQTFIDPSIDPQGSAWQIQNSLVTIGSGELWGRGFGQSIQKFTHLPEPTSDSIFAVYAEEVGFIGSLFLILLFIAFALRGLKIARRAPDQFSRLLVSGIAIMIVLQSFVNIAAMLNLIPLTGIPLVFVSHGGTSLLVNLAAIGIILNISRYKNNN